jgi:hypothetical protein
MPPDRAGKRLDSIVKCYGISFRLSTGGEQVIDAGDKYEDGKQSEPQGEFLAVDKRNR